MSDSNQTAARLAQVARRLEGAGGGFAEASTSGSGPLADDGLPREPTLVTLVDVETGRAYHAVTLDDGSIVLELSDLTAEEAVSLAARTSPADAHHPTRFAFSRLRSDAGFFGVAHPASGRYLQAKKSGRHRLMFFSNTCGVNEQFEARDVRDVNPNARRKTGAGADATLAVASFSPRRFPETIALRVRLCNALATLPEPNTFEAAVISGTVMPTSGWGFGSARSSARSSVSLEATPSASAAPSPLPAPPAAAPADPRGRETQKPKRDKPPTDRDRTRDTKEASTSSQTESQTESRAGSTYATPTVSPTTFATRKSWRVALSLAPESAPSLPPSLPGSAARKGRYETQRRGTKSVYGSAASTPGLAFGARAPLGVTPTPGGHVFVGDASQGDALDLGVRLMSKFAREMEMSTHRRYLRQVWSVWRRHHEGIRATAARAARLASLMRRAIQRRNFRFWASTASETAREKASARVARRVLDRRARSRAFYVWKRTHARTRALRQRVSRATARFTKNALAVAFQDWAFLVEAGKRAEEDAAFAAEARERAEAVLVSRRNRATRFAKTRAERSLRLCLSRWRSEVMEEKRRRVVVTRVVKRATRRSLAAAFDGWTEAASFRRRARVTALRVTQRWSRRSLSFSFSKWRESLRRKKQFESKARAAQKFLRAMYSNVAYRAFNRWRSFSADAAAAERAARRCVQRMLRRRLASSFYDWCDFVENAATNAARVETAVAADARLERACERFLNALRRKNLVSAWNGWRDRASALAATRRKLKKCVARFASRALATSFERWAEETESAARSRRIARRAIARLTLGALARTFNAWLEFVSRRANRRALSNIATRAAHKLMWNACGVAFAHWAELIEAKRKAAREAEQAQVMYEAKVKRAERFILRWKQQSLADAFFQWRINVRVCREESARLNLVVSRMLNRRAYAAFNRWLALVEENTRKRQMLAWTVGRISRPSTSAAFEAWRDTVDARKAKAATDQERWLADVRKAERFMLAWRKRDVSTMFIRWRMHTVECKRQRRVVSRCVARMQHRSLASSFNRWSLATSTLRRERVIVRRALEKLKRREMASAFYEWSDMMSDKRMYVDKVAVAERFLMAFSQRLQFRAFNRWREAARKLRTDGVKVARCIQKMTRNACASAFLDWAELVEAKRKAAREAEQAQVMYEAKVKRAERFILRWKQQSLADAFFQWRINVRVCREESARLNLVVSRMLNRRAYAAFNRWLALVEENTRKRQMLAWTVGRISRPSTSAAFEAWRDTVDARKAKAVTEHERWLADVRKAERFMLAWRKRDVSTMFIRWRMHTVECKRQRRVVSRCVARMQHRSLASSFNRWSLATSTLRRERVIVRRALEKLKRREMASAFYEWSDMMSDKRMYVDKVAVAERFLMAFSQRLQFRAFNRWREAARKLRTDGVKVARCIQKMTRNACASAFLDWAELVEAKRKAAREAEQAQVMYEAKVKRAERFILRWKQQSLADAFFQWRINVRVCREESARLNLVVSRMLNRRAFGAFNAWVDLVEENTRKRQMLAWTVGRISRPSTSAAFEAWHDTVDARKAKAATDQERWLADVRKAERFVLAMRKRGLSHAFIRWRLVRQRNGILRRRLTNCLTRLSKRTAYKALSTWAGATWMIKRQRALVQRALARFSRDRLANAFFEWEQRVRDKAAFAAKVGLASRFANALRSREQFRAFNRWREAARKLRADGVKVARCIQKMTRNACAVAFLEWAELVESRRRDDVATRRLMEISLRRSMNRVVYASFAGWANETSERRRRRVIVRRCVAKLARRAREEAFYDWRDAAGDAARLRLALRRSLTRLTQRVAYAAFSGWASRAKARSRQRRLLANCVTRLSTRLASAALDGWADAAAAKRRRRALCGRALTRMTQRATFAAFGRWVDEVARAKAAAATQKERLRLNESKMERFVQIWRKRAFSVAYVRWRDATRRNVAARRRLSLMTFRLRNRVLIAAWNAWKVAAVELRVNRDAGKRVIAAMTRDVLRLALYGWRDHVRDEKAFRASAAKAERFLMAFARRAQFLAFNRWREAARKLRTDGVKVARCIQKMTRNACASAFLDWAELVEAKRKAAREAEEAQARYEAKVKRAERFILRWKQQSLADAFFQWRINVRVCREESARLNLVVSRMLNRRAFGAFNAWVDLVEENTRKRQMLAWTVGRISRPSTSAAFEAWHDMVHARKVEAATEHERWLAGVRKAERFMLAWRKRDVSTMFIRWRMHMVECKRQRRVVSRCVARMQHRSLASSFNRWSLATETLRRQRVIVRRALERMTRRALASSFYEWRRVTSGALDWTQKLAAAGQFIGALRHRELFRAFSRWREAARKLRTDGVKVARCIQKMTRDACARSFIAWAELVEAKRKAAREAEEAQARYEAKVKRAERFILRWKQQSLADAFFQWRINVRVCREESARLNLVVSRMLNRRAFGAFNAWVDLVEENTRKRQMLAWTVGRISRPSTSAAFEAWRDLVEKASTEKERWLAGVRKAERFMLAWRKRDVSTMFIRWRMHTVECKRQRRIVSRCVARMQHRSLASSMNRWSLATAKLQRERVIVRRALEKLKRREMASAFYEWSDMMSDKRMYVDKVAVAERFLMAFSQRLQFRAFNRWREAARKLRTDGVKVARCIQKMTRNACASAFLDWAELIEAKRKAAREAEEAQARYEAKVKRAERFILRWKQQSLADAFFQWRINVRVCREESARLNLVVSRMLNRRAFGAFNAWVDLVEENTRKRQMLAWTVGRISRPSTSAAFEAWRDLVEKASTEKERWLAGVRKAERFMLAWRKRDVSTMFIRWRMHTVECKRQRRIVSRCVARMQHRSLASSMNRWSLATAKLQRERVIVRRALEKLKRREMASAFYEWSDMMSDKRMYVDKVAVAERFLMAFSQRLQFRAFNRWREAARKLRTDGVKVARCIQKMTRDACARSFIAWAELVEAKRKAAREAEEAQARYEAKVKRAERFILRWKQQSLADAFFQWQSITRKCREDGARLRKAVSRMLNRRAFSVFNAWVDLVEENTRRRQVLAWTVGRISRLSASLAFEAWRECVRRAVTEQELWLAGVRKAERFMLAWLKRDVSTMFIRWRSHTSERSKQRRIVARVVARMQHRSLASSFNRWTRETAKLQRDRVVVRRALERMTRREMATAFYEWRRVTSGALDWTQKLAAHGRFVGALRHRELFRAFSRWREAARKLRTDGVKVARCIQKMTRNACASAFLDWAELVEAKRKAAREAEEAQARYEAKVKRAERFILRWKQQSLADAFFQWRINVRVCREESARLNLVVSRMLNRRAFGAFNAWVDLVEENTRKRQMLAWTVGRISRPSTSAAFEAWRDMVEARKVEAASEQELWLAGVRKAERFMLAWRKRDVSTMFIRWRMHTVECKRQRRIVSRCVARMQHRSLASSFNRWTRETAKLQRDRVVVRRALERMRRKSLASAFYEWSDLMDDRRRFAEKAVTADRFVMAMRHRGAFRAFNRWREAARKLRADGVRLARCIQKMTRNACARAFIEWAERVEAKRRAARSISRFVGAMRHRAQFRSFNRWREAARKLKRDRVKVTQCLQRMRRAAFARAFQDWAELVERSRRDALEEALEMKSSLLESKTTEWDATSFVHASFSRWRAAHVQRVSAFAGAQAAFRRVSKTRRRAAAFRRWRGRATVERRARNVVSRWRRRVESRALQRWAGFARSSRVARRAAARWASRRVSDFFRAWRLASVSRIARRTSEALAAAATGSLSLSPPGSPPLSPSAGLGFGSRSAQSRAALSLARTRVSDADRARVARFAAAAFYERRSKDFLARLVSRWRALVVEARRRTARLGDEMRLVLQRRSARRVLDAWNERAFRSSARRAKNSMAARFGKEARLAKVLLGWRAAVAEALAARGTPLRGGMKSRSPKAGTSFISNSSFSSFDARKENAAPTAWDWNASVLQNVSASSPSLSGSSLSRSGGRTGFGASAGWHAPSPVPLPSLDLDLGAAASPTTAVSASEITGSPGQTFKTLGGGAPRTKYPYDPRTPADSLRGKRVELSSIDAQRRRAARESPARGALDAAYREVLAECAELEASVEAMGTGAAAPSRLGASARRSDASADRTSADSMDARLVDAGSRAAGLLERAEAMRREMREVSEASRGERGAGDAGA